MALVAEEEARAISARTKAALAAAKARGTKLGGFRAGARVDYREGVAARQEAARAFAARVRPMVAAMRAEGRSLRQIAAALTEQRIRTPQGGAWTAAAVRNLLARHGAAAA